MTVGGSLPTPCHKEKLTADSRKSHKMEILIAPHSSQLHLGGIFSVSESTDASGRISVIAGQMGL